MEENVARDERHEGEQKAVWEPPVLKEHGDMRQITGAPGIGVGDFFGDPGLPGSEG